MALAKTSGIAAPVAESAFMYASIDTCDFVLCKSPEKLKLLLDAMQPGKQVHFICNGDWSLHDMVMELVKKHRPVDIHLSTYALRELPVRQLIMAMERNDIVAVNIILDTRAKVRTPEVLQLAEMNMTKIYLTAIHAKVTVIRSAEVSITIVGSQNWTTNPKVEAGVVCMDQGAASFHIDWMQKLMSDAEIFK